MSAPVSQEVRDYVDGLDYERRRGECEQLLEIFHRATGLEAELWSSSMIGYGHYHYRYESGHEGDWFLTGFAPRKRALSIYIMPGFEPYEDLMQRLGKHKTGKSCLYLTKLENADPEVLETLIRESVARMEATWK
ncbi:DUF1801 domain-containing protein [Wenzhouxiangella sp. EGI_FJ10409]|uniref:DUF1801 domain-containing protein n=1 Tax=Wenzhouxiangella sp. EGI_FJ10409 TaxID=3243767 RepID=UPI0035D85397